VKNIADNNASAAHRSRRLMNKVRVMVEDTAPAANEKGKEK
jgi:hypothetical protein